MKQFFPVTMPGPPLAVLVVDDDPLIGNSLQMVLEAAGQKVTLACCGEEALALLEAGLAADVVILDLNMPGLGGAGTLPRLRTLRPTLPVILSSGNADPANGDLAASHPHVTLLPKPVHAKDLLRCLGSLRQ